MCLPRYNINWKIVCSRKKICILWKAKLIPCRTFAERSKNPNTMQWMLKYATLLNLKKSLIFSSLFGLYLNFDHCDFFRIINICEENKATTYNLFKNQIKVFCISTSPQSVSDSRHFYRNGIVVVEGCSHRQSASL